jgi:hypothetical protein
LSSSRIGSAVKQIANATDLKASSRSLSLTLPFETENSLTHVTATAKIIDEHNHVEFTLKVKMKVHYAQFQLENLFDTDSFLSKLGNRIINDNYEVFLKELIPGLQVILIIYFALPSFRVRIMKQVTSFNQNWQ